jgi:hypothetical protein
MRPDGWIFMVASWLIIIGLFTFALVKILRQKK